MEVSKGVGGIGVDMTYVCTVASTDDQASVEHEFHVAGAAGFGTGCGDMLADIRCRGDDLRLADVVILDVDHLQQITDVFVMVDDFPNATDKVDDRLCHPVAWRSFTAKD